MKSAEELRELARSLDDVTERMLAKPKDSFFARSWSTKDLTLRPLKVGDGAAYRALLQEVQIAGNLPATKVWSAERYDSTIAFPLVEMMQLVVLRRRKFIGVAGYVQLSPRRYELLIFLLEKWHGHGFGKQLGQFLIEHAHEALGVERIYGAPDIRNVASNRLCRALGMKRDRLLYDDERGVRRVFAIDALRPLRRRR